MIEHRNFMPVIAFGFSRHRQVHFGSFAWLIARFEVKAGVMT